MKQAYQLQQWGGILWQRMGSGLTVKEWRLEQAQPTQLAEVALAPRTRESHSKRRLTTESGTQEIMDAAQTVLDQVLMPPASTGSTLPADTLISVSVSAVYARSFAVGWILPRFRRMFCSCSTAGSWIKSSISYEKVTDFFLCATAFWVHGILNFCSFQSKIVIELGSLPYFSFSISKFKCHKLT